jgi:hypothetical protein
MDAAHFRFSVSYKFLKRCKYLLKNFIFTRKMMVLKNYELLNSN